MTQPTREIKIPVPEGYDRLSQVLFRALDQAATGKGKERHSSGEPFEDQPICVIARWVGIGGPLQQAIKKIQESVRLLETQGPDKSIFELLGAINYITAAVIILEEMSLKDKYKNYIPEWEVYIEEPNFCMNCLHKPCACGKGQ